MTELEQLKVDIFILESKLKMEKSFSLAILSLLGPEDERLARRLELLEKVAELSRSFSELSKLCFSKNEITKAFEELDAFNKETRG